MSDLNDFLDNADPNSLDVTPDGKGLGVHVQNKFLKHMTDSDKPECEFKRGDTVEKATFELGDMCEIGTKGIILGTLFEKTLGEAYLILFETNNTPVFTIKKKIRLWESQE